MTTINSILNKIHKIKDYVPNNQHNFRKQLEDIKKELIITRNNVSGWDALTYVINEEIPYPPKEEWQFEILAEYNEISVDEMKEMYIIH